MGIKASLLYPLLHDVGVISNKNNKVTFNLHYCNDVFKLAHNEAHPDHQISFSYKRVVGCQTDYYLCIGKARYASIAKQLKDSSFTYPRKRQPKKIIATIIERLENKYQTYNINAITNDGTNILQFDIQQQQ